MAPQNELLTVDEALALLVPDEETVHVFTSHLIGADWPRAAVEAELRAARGRALARSPLYRGLGHALGWVSADGFTRLGATVEAPDDALAAFRAAQAARVVARVLRLPFSDAAPVLYRHRSGLWYLEEPRIAAPLGVWSATGLPVHAAGDDALPVLPLLSDGATAGQAWRALLLALRPRIAALWSSP